MISVVIPAYNEERRLGATLESVVRYLAASADAYEVLVVDDGSTDATVSVASQWADKHVRVLTGRLNRGKGAAVRRGVLETHGDLVLISDADLSTPIAEVAKLRRVLAEGADVILGSRGLETSVITRRQPFYRERMGKTFNVAVRLLLGWSFRDTQCGFKLFAGDVARRVFALLKEEGFGFDVEAIHLALSCGYVVREVPVEWRNSPDSRVHIFRSSAAMLCSLLRVVTRERQGYYRRVASLSHLRLPQSRERR
jgi:dolichyl-phosphate beta-glucosyltransferase